MALQNRKERLKVLVVDEEIPYPADTGKRIRTWNLLKRLAQKHSVHFLCYGRGEHGSTEVLRSAGLAVHLVEPLKKMSGLRLYLRLLWNLFSPYPFSVAKHYSRRFQKALDDLLKESGWDLIQCEWTPYARFVRPERLVPVLIAAHNIESQIWKRRAENSRHFIARAFFGLQARKMAWFERRALLAATAATAVSDDDAQAMRQWGVQAVRVVPNGVDPEFYESVGQAQHENIVLCVASLDWFPNVDAVQYFIDEIFPLIRKRMPNCIFRIVGRRPPEFLKEKLSNTPDIDLVGEVSDVRPYLEQATVIAVPLRIGGGSRLKILEALAAGKAVVSTTVGAEGLQLDPGKHLLIADSPHDFAGRVSELLMSPETRRRLGEEGRNFVSKEYAWGTIATRLQTAWLDSVRRGAVSELIPAAVHEIGVAS
jgi:sugar transferase (PEP-CTERM/EpsH1 system associated)